MADWSTLPFDILGAIALKFEDIVDCIYFCAVCHSFNHAYLMVKETSQKNFMLWLFLAENIKENPECFRKLFSLSTKKCYQLSLPETFGRRCWGSNYGWIVTLGLDHEMHLFNPLTKARICLPHPSTLPTYKSYKGDSEYLRLAFVTRAIVLRIPDEFVVMVAYGECRKVAFARIGDQVWTPVRGPKFNRVTWVDDFCYRDGKILVLFASGSVGYCDISSSTPRVRILMPAHRSMVDAIIKIEKGRCYLYHVSSYLVNSNNELLIVRRYKSQDKVDKQDKDEGDDSYSTKKVVVLRADFNTKKWTKLNDLGDSALFVGDGHSTSRNCLYSRYCVRNQVYCTDDMMEYWELPKELGGHDMGAFNIGDKHMKIIPFYEGVDIHSGFCTPFLFTPMI